MVLKVSAIEGTEPQTLAQLQHTNIVPIYSVHEDARAGAPRRLHALLRRGQPLGGPQASSGEAPARRRRPGVRRGAGGRPAPRRSRNSAAGRGAAAAGRVDPGRGAGDAAASRSAGLNYVQAAAWVVARLAEGCSHAHQRGVLHRDIKPSNILISADGQPLLLDFNLAHEREQRPPPTRRSAGRSPTWPPSTSAP